MNNLTLIQHLTWAIIEADLANPNMEGIKDALAQALTQALLAQEHAFALRAAALKTMQVMGQ